MSEQSSARRDGRLLAAERILWAAGIVCLGAYTVLRIVGAAGARDELARFEKLREAPAPRALPADPSPSRGLWSAGRIRAFRESLKRNPPAPLAVLRIRRIGLEAPVLEGTDDWTLNRAVGHIGGTAAPGASGNCGIAGHRDGFFRGLKDVVPGDTLELTTLQGNQEYRIEKVRIVEPEDVFVLDPTPQPTLSLVTCYPFYFVGSAPKRYVVRAVRVPVLKAGG
ncbi:MAG: class D sortase [Acidobacteriota bacterium]